MDYLKIVEDNCIKCGLCTDNCPFLSKYNINLLDYTKREDLAYSCFLCNKCSDVCPKNLNGKYISLTFRKNNPKYRLVKLNKESYPFRNLPKKNRLVKGSFISWMQFPSLLSRNFHSFNRFIWKPWFYLFYWLLQKSCSKYWL